MVVVDAHLPAIRPERHALLLGVLNKQAKDLLLCLAHTYSIGLGHTLAIDLYDFQAS